MNNRKTPHLDASLATRCSAVPRPGNAPRRNPGGHRLGYPRSSMKTHHRNSSVFVFAAMISLLVVTGCSSGVTRYSAPAATAMRVSESNKVGEVNLSLSAAAKEDL